MKHRTLRLTVTAFVAPRTRHASRHQERLRLRSWPHVYSYFEKGIVGGFEFTVLPEKFERMARGVMEVCLRIG